MIDLAWWDFAALEGLRADDRLRVLSREAMAVMFRLVLVARAGCEVPYLNHHTGAQSVAVYDLRESDTTATRDACARAVKELVDVGLVVLDDAARVIRLDLHAGVLAREVEVAAGADVAESGGPRRAPSHSPERNALRKLRYQFTHRAGPFRGVEVPEGATWETWSVSAEGVAFLAGRNKGRNNPEQGLEQGGNKAGTTRNNPEQAPPLTLSPLENKGNEEKEAAREASQEQGGTRRRNKGGNNPEQGREQPRRQRAPRVHAADTIPLPGSPEREVYDAIVGDPVLCPITANPGDFAARAVGGAYPNLTPAAIAAVVRRCGEYAAREPGRYTDGRRALSNWLKEEDARAAARPRPTAQVQSAAAPQPRPRDDSGDRPRGPVLSAQQRAAASREFIAALKSPITEDA